MDPEDYADGGDAGSTALADGDASGDGQTTANGDCSVCYYGGQTYSEGAVLCFDHANHECRGGAWHFLSGPEDCSQQ